MGVKLLDIHGFSPQKMPQCCYSRTKPLSSAKSPVLNTRLSVKRCSRNNWCKVPSSLKALANLNSISKMDTLSNWLFRRGASLRSFIKIFFRGAPRLNDQSDRVFILGVGINKDRFGSLRSDPGTNPDRSAKLWIIAEPGPMYLYI